MSYHASLPSGPAIILSAGAAYLFSILAGPRGVLRSRVPPPPSPDRLIPSNGEDHA